MNTKQITIISTLILLVFSAVIYISMSISYKNQEHRLRNQIEAKIDDSKSHYTKMFEILVNQANVSAKYAEDFKEIYPSLIEGRYNNGGGQLMQWIQEHNPQFDTSLYNTLMQSIEAQRESFHNNQRQLIDMSRQHNNLLTVFPSSFFLSDIEKIDIPVIVNTATEKAFDTGLEQDMNIFNRPVKDTIK